MKPILFLLLIVLSACTPKERNFQNDESIIGGRDAKGAGLYDPAVVSIWYNDKWGTCTGVLIAQDLVLTAAHCRNESQEPYVCFSHKTPMILTLNRELENSCVRVKKSFVPEQFVYEFPANTTRAYDIRLMLLSKNAPNEITPMLLPKPLTRLRKGQFTVVAGFGNISIDPVKSPSELQVTSVPFAEHYGDAELRFANFNGHNACRGDSGGPVYFKSKGKNVLIGIVSRSVGTDHRKFCRDGFMATDVTQYLDWIEETATALRDLK